MYDEEKQMKKKGKKKKLPDFDPELSDKIRVNFPWLATPSACRCKAYIAFVADRNLKRARGVGNRKKFFDSCILPRVHKRFPKLYGRISRYYAEKGKPLSMEHFDELLRARYMNMYDGDFKKSHEHPLVSSNIDLRNHYDDYSKVSRRK